MRSTELRQKFLKFFEKNGHLIIPSASLVPSEHEQLEGKEKVLFTSAGMQPLIPYLTGKATPPSKRLVDCQKCLRTDDIEEVGDLVHHTFFEMLGNWSIGDYWKKEAIELSFKFLTEELGIPVEKLAVSVFEGDEDAPRDEESAKVWKDLGIPEKRIFYLGKEHNWWPSAKREQDSGEFKNPFGPCGPDTEMFFWTGEGKPEGSPDSNILWVEIWNDVFMQFNRKEDGTLEDLPQRNVDTGMGLERTLAVLSGKKSAYETDLFLPIIEEIRKSKNNYSEKSERVIADHLKAAVFILSENVVPISSDKRGSVAKILITNAITQENKLLEEDIVHKIISAVIIIYQEYYQDLKGSIVYNKMQDVVVPIYITNRGRDFKEMQDVLAEINTGRFPLEEVKRKYPSLDPVFKLPQTTISGATISGTVSYYYHQSKGISEPVIQGTAQELHINPDEFNVGYRAALEVHNQASKANIGKFAGGLAGHSEIEIKYHTATHLLHQALRDVLGPEVFQKGSNITIERLRFDFSFPRKMTEGEVKAVEDLVNKKIKEDLKVDRKFMTFDEAKNLNAIGLFDEKYDKNNISIYAIGPDYILDPDAKDTRERGGYYSLEFCGGPHVGNTGVIGAIKITKEEAVSEGVRRIRAVLS